MENFSLSFERKLPIAFFLVPLFMMGTDQTSYRYYLLQEQSDHKQIEVCSDGRTGQDDSPEYCR